MSNLYFEAGSHIHYNPDVVKQHIRGFGYEVCYKKVDKSGGLYFIIRTDGVEDAATVIEKISDLWLASEVVEISEEAFNSAEQDGFTLIGGTQQ